MEDDRWWTRENRDETVADEVVRATAELGTTSAVHLYDWHKIPFDNDYPHYFPVKDELADALKTLRAAGIKIMPYINGRLWDTKDRQNAVSYTHLDVYKRQMRRSLMKCFIKKPGCKSPAHSRGPKERSCALSAEPPATASITASGDIPCRRA